MAEPATPPPEPRSADRVGPAGWVAIVVLAAFLVSAIAYAVYAWNSLSGVKMPATGWLFMILGAVVTFGLGAGLMALVFYSSRKGRDF